MSAINELWASAYNRDNKSITEGRTCKMCEGNATPFGVVDFNKSCNNYPLLPSFVAVNYYRCDECELIFTDFCDQWTEKEFSNFIYNDDYILVDPEYVGTRARNDAVAFGAIFAPVKDRARILDYGGGMGVFANTLRELGFDSAETYDPFSSPNRPEGKFDIVTAFEVIEHSAAPLQTLDDLLFFVNDGGCLIIGQAMQPKNIDVLRCDWWYVSPRNGHLTFYSHRTIEKFAQARNLVYRPTAQAAIVIHKPEISEVSATILDTMKPNVQFLTLCAPARDVNGWGWHQSEQLGARKFRWTGSGVSALGEVDIVAGDNYVTIVFAMEIEPSFADKSALRIGTDLVPLVRKNGMLLAHYTAYENRRCWVELVTPQPRAPKFIHKNSDDERELGLAVWCYESNSEEHIVAAGGKVDPPVRARAKLPAKT